MAVDSFFTNPKKRKRSVGAKSRGKPNSSGPGKTRRGNGAAPVNRDEEITSESENEAEANGGLNEDENGEQSGEEESGSEYEGETEADKRRRLAKQYLANLKDQLVEEEELMGAGEGFDAADLDREILSKRLKEDVAEEQGQIYRYLATQIAETLEQRQNKGEKVWRYGAQAPGFGITGVAAHWPYAYSVSKDRVLAKWDISVSPPKQIRYVKGDHKVRDEEMPEYLGHRGEILCVAASPDGKYVVTGGRDRRLVVWTASTLAPIKVLETRDRKGAVNALCFRRGTNELYAACADLKVRTFNIDLSSMVETLYGHQDAVMDVSALSAERCVTVGARDRTAMLWKITEESRLTFRGGESERNRKKFAGRSDVVFEGSMDVCSMLDDTYFVTGSDNGSIALWSTQRKKPVFVMPLAHGVDPALLPSQASAESDPSKIEIPTPLPRYITALAAVPFSDMFISGSWSSELKVWKLAPGFKSFECVATIPAIKGIVTNISLTEEPGARADVSKLNVIIGISKETRYGRFQTFKKGKNGIIHLKLHT